MIRSVLVACVGNICRSPVAARLLAARLLRDGSSVRVSSAGIAALVGHPADAMAAAVATDHGLSLAGHVARQFTRDLGRGHDLILVMEPWHKRDISLSAPDLSGRVMLFDHWQGGKGIPDPYRQARAVHEAAFARIDAAATEWALRLSPRGTA